MISQLALNLEPALPRSAPPIARTTDPGTSWAAARERTESGAREADAQIILEALRSLPAGATYRELHASLGWRIREAVEVMRRLSSDLAPLDPETKAPLPWQPVLRGPKRKCRVSGRPCLTWWAREYVEAFLAAGGELPIGEINVHRLESECPIR